ncbi:hypothetical protein TNCV_308681 [Trichonephila clavipes]|nr:hypothetical protein TNCV_308681 [Trichonephila clavipes]
MGEDVPSLPMSFRRTPTRSIFVGTGCWFAPALGGIFSLAPPCCRKRDWMFGLSFSMWGRHPTFFFVVVCYFSLGATR